MADSKQVPQWMLGAAKKIDGALVALQPMKPTNAQAAIARIIFEHAPQPDPQPAGEPWNGHTELPWGWNPGERERELDGTEIYLTPAFISPFANGVDMDEYRGLKDEDAEFIVHACNTYYQREAESARLTARVSFLEHELREEGMDEHISKASGSECESRRLVNHRAGTAESERDAARLALKGCVEALETARHATDISEGRLLTIDYVKSPQIAPNDDVIEPVREASKSIRAALAKAREVQP